MMFLFRKKKVVLDLFTDRPDVYDMFKIQPAIKALPDWWKCLPKDRNLGTDTHPGATMKTCMGFIDLYKNSFVQPLWCDLFVKLNGAPNYEYSWQFSDKMSEILIHDKIEVGSSPLSSPLYSHCKITNHWFARGQENVNFMLHDPIWNKQGYDYFLVNGIINFKKNPTNVNLNYIFTQSPQQKTMLLKVGTPIAMLTPMTERNVVLKHHLVSEQEKHMLLRRHSTAFSFINKTKVSEAFSNNKVKSKCPIFMEKE